MAALLEQGLEEGHTTDVAAACGAGDGERATRCCIVNGQATQVCVCNESMEAWSGFERASVAYASKAALDGSSWCPCIALVVDMPSSSTSATSTSNGVCVAVVGPHAVSGAWRAGGGWCVLPALLAWTALTSRRFALLRSASERLVSVSVALKRIACRAWGKGHVVPHAVWPRARDGRGVA